MRRLLSHVLMHPGRVVCLGISTLLLFVLTAAHYAFGGVSAVGLFRSADATLTLMLAIDSPTKLLQNQSPLLIGFGWMICLMGWLFLPLMIGVLVDVSLNRAESYSKLRLLFRELGIAAELDGEKLRRFTDEMMERAAKIIARKEGK
jgi:hypothetical protein